MASPTRAQIESSTAQPTYQVEVFNASGTTWDTISDDEIVSVQGVLESAAGTNGISFGTSVFPSCTITTTEALLTYDWHDLKVRISYSFESADMVRHFTGIVISRKREDRFLVFECRGFDMKIENKKVYSPLFYRRPLATDTTLTSVEDPTNASYQAGLMNYVFWQCGGRPYAQESFNISGIGIVWPSAEFYYDCDPALIAPEWSWISGEDALDDLFRMARATGGQVYQDTLGVMRYVQPFSFSNGTPIYTFTDGTGGGVNNFATITEEANSVESFSTIQCTYTIRRLEALQEVYNKDEPFIIASGETKTIIAETQYPVYTYEYQEASIPSGVIASGIVAHYFDGRAAYLGATINTSSAQKLSITLTNTSYEPVVVSNLLFKGRPIIAGDAAIAKYGNGTPELQLEDNPYIQTEDHAFSLCRMTHDFYSQPRQVITLGNCGFDTDRLVGELVYVTYQPWTMSGVLHRIISLEHEDTGAMMNVKLVNVEDIPARSDFYIVGTSYNANDIYKVSYAGATNSAADTILNTQPEYLVAFWPLWDTSGTTVDNYQSDSDRDGLYVNGTVLLASGIDGRYSARFDGVNDYVNLYSSSFANAFNGPEGTISIFLKVSSAGIWSDSTFRYALRFAADASNIISILRLTTTNFIQFAYAAGGVTKFINVNTGGNTGWFQLTLTWNKTLDRVKVYYDGVQTGTTQTGLGTWTGTLLPTITVLGVQDTTGSFLWSGEMSHVAVWSKELTPNEIAQIARKR